MTYPENFKSNLSIERIGLIEIQPGWTWIDKYFADYNHGYNIMRIFDVLPNFPFTTSEKKPDY